MAEGRQAAHDPLYPLQVSNRPHPSDGLDFLRVGFNASLGDDEAQEHASRHSKHALLGVELYPLGPKAIECDPEIGYQVVHLLGFHDNVIDICFYGSPDMILKHVEHTSVVCSFDVSKAKGHRDVAVHVERGDKRSRELVGLFHLYLMVARVSIKEG